MIPLDDVARRLLVDPGEIAEWIDNAWVLPRREGERWLFEEIDVARAQFILEMRRELELGEDALALVLSLLDQLYAVRRDHRLVCEALRRQPTEIRAAIARAIEELGASD